MSDDFEKWFNDSICYNPNWVILGMGDAYEKDCGISYFTLTVMSYYGIYEKPYQNIMVYIN